MTILRVLALPLILIANFQTPTDQQYSGVTKYAGFSYLSPYKPRHIQSLDEISKPIRDRVSEHLQSRLGSQFFSRLRFTEGEVVDLEELYRVNPNAENYQWEVAAYALHFEFSIPEVGIDSYTAHIELQEDGSVLEEIDLPAFATHPEKLRILPLVDAWKLISDEAFDPKVFLREIAYDRENDILVWRFRHVVEDDGLRLKIENIEVGAHNGEIRRYETVGIRE